MDYSLILEVLTLKNRAELPPSRRRPAHNIPPSPCQWSQ